MPCKIIWWPLGTRSNVGNNTMSLSWASIKGLETNIMWHITDVAWMPLILSSKMQQKLPHWYANNCHWYTDTKTVKHACAVIECTGSTLYNATLTEMRILQASVLCILNERLEKQCFVHSRLHIHKVISTLYTWCRPHPLSTLTKGYHNLMVKESWMHSTVPEQVLSTTPPISWGKKVLQISHTSLKVTDVTYFDHQKVVLSLSTYAMSYHLNETHILWGSHMLQFA